MSKVGKAVGMTAAAAVTCCWRHRRALGLGVTATAAGACYWRHRRRTAQPDLTGQVVLITGGSRGLGLNLARTYGQAGAHVAICARNETQVHRAARELQAEGVSASAHVCDVRESDAVTDLVEQVVDDHGRLDV